MTVAVCMKLVARRVEVDPLDASVRVDPTSWGASPADEAALEIALRQAEATGSEVVAVCAGPESAEVMLRDALARGARRAVRVDLDADADSGAVAAALAAAVRGSELVVCGDHSLDRGSGAVPAFLAACLGVPQALGCTEVGTAPLVASRRTDRGGREVLRVTGPAVVSVEGSSARLRRAGVSALLDASASRVELVAPESRTTLGAAVTATRPYRPRPRYEPAPTPTETPLGRIVVLTDAMTERTPPRLLELDPDSAAAAIVDQLAEWGYPTEPGAQR